MKKSGMAALVLVFIFQTWIVSAVEIMPLSEIKEGMTGVGRTVFKGNQIEEFQVEILGVLRNYMPQQSLILGVLKGNRLEETGVIAGMSGSPVFIDGKIAGAVAYAWAFAKVPVAGITPIESMLEAQVSPREQAPISPPIELSEYYNFESLLTNHFQTPGIDASVPGVGLIRLRPISSALTVSGFDQKVIDRFSPLFSAMGWQPVQGGAAGQDSGPVDENLEPGSPVSVQLIKGDFDIAAMGTVTYRDADKVLAFGHPFFNLGPIDLPMATARIYGVVPSLYSSFKLGASGATVGSIKQDLHSAVFGIMGRKSPMIPVTVNLRNEDNEKRTFRFQVAYNKLLSAILVDFAFQNTILVTQLGYSESTLRVSGLINVKNRSPILIKNIFSGVASFANASQYFASILYVLMANEFEKVEIEDVVIEVDSMMKPKEAELLEVWLDKNEVRPGEELKIKALYRPQFGKTQVEEFTTKIPADLKLNQIYFIAGGGQELSRQEYQQYGKAYQPASLDQMISLLNSLRSNDRIYIKAFSNEPSLMVKGQLMPSLPSSVYTVLSSAQTVGSSQKLSRLALWEDNHPIDYYLTGIKYFMVKVLPKQD